MKIEIILLFSLVIVSCKGDFANKEIEASYNRVMVIHDEVMPEISTINKLKRQIKKIETDNPRKAYLITALDKSDDGMMDWMADFKLNKKAEVSEQLSYLEAEQTRIQNVSDMMKRSIKEAQDFIQENQLK